MTKKKPYGKGNPPPGWEENVGWWGKDPEGQLAAARKGGKISAENRKKEAAAKRLLEDKRTFILESASRVTAQDPDWFDRMLSMFMKIMDDPEADPKDRMAAADKLTSIIGTQAPKTQEVKVEQTSFEDTEEELKSLGVEIKGLNVITGGKE